MKRFAILFGLSGIAAMAFALTTFTKVFHAHYEVKKGSFIEKSACLPCHATAKGGKLNAYGLDLQKVMKAAGTKKFTPAILEKVEQLDSDKDGMKNVDEIKKDRNPGVADK